MKIAIYGAGSLGIVLGAFLNKAGLDAALINHNREQVDALNSKGAHVTGLTEMTVPARAFLPEDMGDGYDLIFLLTKQLDNAAVARFLKDRLSPVGIVCTLQNGLPEEELALILGKDRVMGCTVSWGATLEGPGVSRLTSDPKSMTFGLGPAEGPWNNKCAMVQGVLEKMCPVERVGNLKSARWSKLLINAAFSGTGTVMGGTFGDAAKDHLSRRICLEVIQECIRVGHASGVTFAPVQGNDIVKLMYWKNPIKKEMALAILPVAIRKHAAIEPSMLRDLKNGRKCEINAINGAVCAAGRKVDVPTPVNSRIVEIITRMENGELQPGKDNLKLFGDLKL